MARISDLPISIQSQIPTVYFKPDMDINALSLYSFKVPSMVGYIQMPLLTWAIRYKPNIVVDILKIGADTYRVDSLGFQPISHALQMYTGCGFGLSSLSGKSIPHVCVEYNEQYINLVAWLLNRGVQPNTNLYSGEVPRDHDMQDFRSWYIKILDVILNIVPGGFDPNRATSDQHPLIQICAEAIFSHSLTGLPVKEYTEKNAEYWSAILTIGKQMYEMKAEKRKNRADSDAKARSDDPAPNADAVGYGNTASSSSIGGSPGSSGSTVSQQKQIDALTATVAILQKNNADLQRQMAESQRQNAVLQEQLGDFQRLFALYRKSRPAGPLHAEPLPSGTLPAQGYSGAAGRREDQDSPPGSSPMVFGMHRHNAAPLTASAASARAIADVGQAATDGRDPKIGADDVLKRFDPILQRTG